MITEQDVIDWLADAFQDHMAADETAVIAARRMADRAQNLLYFATGRHFEVRQVIPNPTQPRPPRRRQGSRG